LNSKKLLARIVENWPAKVLSVALALILVVFHRVATLEIRSLSVPLRVETRGTLVPASAYARLIKVSLRGEASSISSIAETDIEAYIDLTKPEVEGLYRAPVQVRTRGSALGVEPLEISVDPLEVSIKLDRKLTKSVPLTVAMQGKVAGGFDLVSHSVSPMQILVEGPLNELGPVKELRTDVVDLDGRNGDFSLMVNIVTPNPLFVLRGNGMAEFRGVIRPSVPVRNIEGIPVELLGLDSRFEAGGGRAGSVRLEGAQAALDMFIPPDGFLSVDCSGIREPGAYTLPVDISLPEGFTLVRREPEEINITVTPREDSGE
jgi:hypothetical protein